MPSSEDKECKDISGQKCSWLLRTPGKNSDTVAYVLRNFICDTKVGYDMAIRPVMWIDLQIKKNKLQKEIDVLVQNIEKCKNEIEKQKSDKIKAEEDRNRKIQQEKTSKAEKIKTLQMQCNALESQISNLKGLFTGKKKAELSYQLSAKQNEITELENKKIICFENTLVKKCDSIINECNIAMEKYEKEILAKQKELNDLYGEPGIKQ